MLVDRPRLRTLLLTVSCGLAIVASMPPWGWWPLAFVGMALLDHLVREATTWRSRFRRGVLVGFAWLLPGTFWMLDFTPPGFVLAAGIYAVLLGLALAATPSGPIRAAALPATIVAFELVRWYWPFGGVPLATLPMGQIGGPLAPSVRLLGPALLSALVVIVGWSLASVVRRRPIGALAGLTVVAGVVALAHVAPRAQVTGDVAVAVVQGGGDQRTRANICENRAVFERHLAATNLITTNADLVLWPENVVNPELDDVVDPGLCRRPLLTVSEADQRLKDLARELGAVLIPGWFHDLDKDETVNYSTAVTPRGLVVDRYDKEQLVPFGEFVPFRSLLEPFAGGALPTHDVRPGTGDALLDTPVGAIGVSISWEVFFEHRTREAITDGAEILANPTNGSSYWLTIVQTQQIASSRLRALESDRWVLQAAPTGFSAIVAPDGTVVARTRIGEQAVLERTVELRRGRTLASRVGVTPMAILAAAAIAGSWAFEMRRRFTPRSSQ